LSTFLQIRRPRRWPARLPPLSEDSESRGNNAEPSDRGRRRTFTSDQTLPEQLERMGMLIALDAMGGDRAPAEVVKGAVLAAQQFGVEISLVGPPDQIGAELKRLPTAPGISIIPASDQIAMDEHPLDAVRRKRQSSIVIGMELVKAGRADAFVSAGNTGAVLAAATLILGRLDGVERPALGAVMPGKDGKRVLMLDAGANAD